MVTEDGWRFIWRCTASVETCRAGIIFIITCACSIDVVVLGDENSTLVLYECYPLNFLHNFYFLRSFNVPSLCLMLSFHPFFMQSSIMFSDNWKEKLKYLSQLSSSSLLAGHEIIEKCEHVEAISAAQKSFPKLFVIDENKEKKGKILIEKMTSCLLLANHRRAFESHKLEERTIVRLFYDINWLPCETSQGSKIISSWHKPEEKGKA